MNPGSNKPKKPMRLAGAEFNLDGSDRGTHIDDDEDDDDGNVAGTLMEVVCVHPGAVVKFTIDGHRHKMREGDVIKIPAAYACPVQFKPQSDPLPSVIERETMRKVLPLTDPRVKRDEKTGEPLAFKARRAREEAKAKERLQAAGQGA